MPPAGVWSAGTEEDGTKLPPAAVLPASAITPPAAAGRTGTEHDGTSVPQRVRLLPGGAAGLLATAFPTTTDGTCTNMRGAGAAGEAMDDGPPVEADPNETRGERTCPTAERPDKACGGIPCCEVGAQTLAAAAAGETTNKGVEACRIGELDLTGSPVLAGTPCREAAPPPAVTAARKATDDGADTGRNGELDLAGGTALASEVREAASFAPEAADTSNTNDDGAVTSGIGKPAGSTGGARTTCRNAPAPTPEATREARRDVVETSGAGDLGPAGCAALAGAPCREGADEAASAATKGATAADSAEKLDDAASENPAGGSDSTTRQRRRRIGLHTLAEEPPTEGG